MKTLIIYDSVFGNTGKIAQAIYSGFENDPEVICNQVGKLQSFKLEEMGLLLLGSPTRGFRPTPVIAEFIRKIPAKTLKGCAVAVFDTRISLATINSSALRFIVRTGGYAASRMANQLSAKGAQLIMLPEGFYVSGEQGPLLEGETERAARWAKKIHERKQHLAS